MSRVTVRWSDDLIRLLSTEGRKMKPGESIEVTAGLPEDAKLVSVELLHPYGPIGQSPQVVQFFFETDEDVGVDEIVVEHRVEFEHGRVPVEDIRTVNALIGALTLGASPEEFAAVDRVHAWLRTLESEATDVGKG